MPCLPLYRLLMAATLLIGTITASRLGHTGQGDPCRDPAGLYPCAALAKPLPGPAQQARGKPSLVLRAAS